MSAYDAGEWKYRRDRRATDSARPSDVAQADPRTGFVDGRFHAGDRGAAVDRHRESRRPPPDEEEEGGSAASRWPPMPPPVVPSAERWVAVRCQADAIGAVREYLDINVGRTVGHCIPDEVLRERLGSGGGGGGGGGSSRRARALVPHQRLRPAGPAARVESPDTTFYVLFSAAPAAAQAVRTGSFQVPVRSAVASRSLAETLLQQQQHARGGGARGSAHRGADAGGDDVTSMASIVVAFEVRECDNAMFLLEYEQQRRAGAAEPEGLYAAAPASPGGRAPYAPSLSPPPLGETGLPLMGERGRYRVRRRRSSVFPGGGGAADASVSERSSVLDPSDALNGGNGLYGDFGNDSVLCVLLRSGANLLYPLLYAAVLSWLLASNCLRAVLRALLLGAGLSRRRRRRELTAADEERATLERRLFWARVSARRCLTRPVSSLVDAAHVFLPVMPPRVEVHLRAWGLRRRRLNAVAALRDWRLRLRQESYFAASSDAATAAIANIPVLARWRESHQDLAYYTSLLPLALFWYLHPTVVYTFGAAVVFLLSLLLAAKRLGGWR